MGRGLGKGLEVSVRSSAPISMPGMMDTILNIGDLEGIMTSVKHIFESWNTPRAIEYRRLNNISSTWGQPRSCRPWFTVIKTLIQDRSII